MYKNYLEIPMVCAECGSCDVFQRIDGKFYCSDCEKIVQIEPEDGFMGRYYGDDDWQN